MTDVLTDPRIGSLNFSNVVPDGPIIELLDFCDESHPDIRWRASGHDHRDAETGELTATVWAIIADRRGFQTYTPIPDYHDCRDPDSDDIVPGVWRRICEHTIRALDYHETNHDINAILNGGEAPPDIRLRARQAGPVERRKLLAPYVAAVDP